MAVTTHPPSVQSETALMHSWVLEGVKVLFVFCKDVNQSEDIDWTQRSYEFHLEPRTTSLNKSEVKMHVGL